MNSLVVLTILLATVATTCRAQIVSFGRCAVPSVVQDFDVAAYLGKWYEIERYEQVFQRNGECVTATYTLNEDGSVRVENAMLVPPSGKFDVDIGRAVLSFPDEEPLQAKLNVSFGGMPPIASNYWVLDTDYENFAFVFSCFSVGNFLKADNYWLLSRTQELLPDVQDRVDKLTDSYLNRRHIRKTRHNLYYCQENIETTTPEPESPQELAKMAERSKRVNG
uniref:Apolipoprotein D n=1 Tax=Culex tarsalis TaxID=7177 RepID=A0A1Q3FS12_CULTA